MSEVAGDTGERVATPEMPNTMLERYKGELDLYKFYLDISVKGALFAFGITGALVSFILTYRDQVPALKFALVLPLILNGGFCYLFYWSAINSKKMSAH